MHDITDLLKWEEMRAVVEAVEALKRRCSQSAASSEHITFSQLASGKFPAREALERLASKDAGYPGQKDVLAAAFSAWLLFPKDKEIRHQRMIQAILDHMNEAEMGAGFFENGWTLERDVAARYLLTGDDFLRDMYDGAGGYQAFMRGNSVDTLDAILDHNMRTIRTAARSMLYLHHGAHRYIEGSAYYRPSINRAGKIFELLRAAEAKSRKNLSVKAAVSQYTYVARSSLHKVWGESKGNLALVYAASCLRATRAKSLLDVLLNAELSHRAHSSLIPKWLGMARHAADTVFSKMGDAGLLKSANRLLDGIAPVEFSPPKLLDEEDKLFLSTFRRYYQRDR